MTPKSSKHINIDELLINYRRRSDYYYSEYDDKVITEAEWFEIRDDIRYKTRQALYQLILDEVIGEDYKIRGLEHPEIEDFYATRNKLKSEQRQKLSKLFGVEK